jgi:hypothetical protein
MSALGTEYKINVHVEPVDGSTMDGLYFHFNNYLPFGSGEYDGRL